MVGNILLILIYLLAPAGVMWLCRKVSWLGKIGPVLVLYVLGIILGNVWHPSGMAAVQEVLSSAAVPLAIPLMLFGCTFRKGETRSQVLAVIAGIVSIITVVIAGYLIFGRSIPDGAKIGGMLTGVYTGGTVNLAAIKVMLGVPEETFILLNSYDMVISFLYLTFLIAIGIKLFRKFLPGNTAGSSNPLETVSHPLDPTGRVAPGPPSHGAEGGTGFKRVLLPVRDYFRIEWLPLVATVAIIGVSAGLGALAGGWFMTVFILLLTTLGIAASFWKPLRERKYNEPTAMYFIYIFSIVVASMADLSKLDISGGLNLLGYLTLVIFGSLILNVLLAKLLRIDADTTVICSVSFICSPPFVPMMAAVMKNRRVIVIGLSAGIIGYAAGNYLGFLISQLLNLL